MNEPSLDEPSRKRRSPRTFPKVSLAIIVVSTVLIAVMASVNQSSDTEMQAAAAGEELEMQLRQIGAQYKLTGADPETALEALEAEFEGDAERRQIALFWAAMADGEHRTSRELRALELLDATGSSAESPLIRRAVTAPQTINGRDQLTVTRATGVAGELALVHTLANDTPEKQAAWNPVVRGVMFAGLVLVAYVLAFFAGLFGLWRLWRRSQAGEQISRLSMSRIDSNIYLEAFAVFVATDALLNILATVIAGASWAWFIGLFQLISLPLGILWPTFRGVRWTDIRKDLGLHRGAGFFREIGAGLWGYCLVLPVFAIGVATTTALSSFVSANAEGAALPTHPDAVGLDGLASWLVFAGLASILAPLAEETLFRGALYRSARGYMSAFVSAVLVSAVFALMHPQGWIAVPALTALAIGFAGLREWRGSLIAPITAHALHNTLLVAVLAAMSA